MLGESFAQRICFQVPIGAIGKHFVRAPGVNDELYGKRDEGTAKSDARFWGRVYAAVTSKKAKHGYNRDMRFANSIGDNR